MLLSLISLSESAEGGAGLTPYYVGGGTLLILFVALGLVLVFGGGREHT
jgi:hypothetical protein